jgi:hypothetical protein
MILKTAWFVTGVLALFVFSCGCFGAAASPSLCAPSDLQIASAAQSDAKGALEAVLHFLNGNDANTQAFVLKWFGSNNDATVEEVSGVIARSSQWLGGVSFYCLYQNDGSIMDDVSTPTGVIRVDASGGLYAYVDPSDLGKVYLGLQFFKAPASTGYDSRLGTLVHEMTHYWITGSTNSEFGDIYPKEECLELARADPAKAQRNAQNYEYFVEEWLKK